MNSQEGYVLTLNDKIDALRAKLTLLESDRKAYYETSSQAINSSKATMTALRKKNDGLRREIQSRLTSDEKILARVFQKHHNEKVMYQGKSSEHVVSSLNDKVCDSMKKLNSLRQLYKEKSDKLQSFKKQYDEKLNEINRANETLKGISMEGQRLRDLENRLAKAKLKCQEAEHIKGTYEQIKSKLYEEHSTYGKTLDDLEVQIKLTMKELDNLRVLHKDAQRARDKIQQDLRRLEDSVIEKRKDRDHEIFIIKKALDSKVADDNQKRGFQVEGDNPISGLSEEQLARISHYEDLFKTIKEVAGVSEINDIVERFESQGATLKHLDLLKTEAEESIAKLREQRDSLKENFESVKYSGHAEHTKGQQILEEYEENRQKEREKKEQAVAELIQASKLLVRCKASMEHLNEKLSAVKVQKDVTENLDSEDPEYLVELLKCCEEKIVILKQSLAGVDIQKELKDLLLDEFYSKAESNMPGQNKRIMFQNALTSGADMEDEVENANLDGEVPTRTLLKKQSQLLIDNKTKKRKPNKTKKKK